MTAHWLAFALGFCAGGFFALACVAGLVIWWTKLWEGE